MFQNVHPKGYGKNIRSDSVRSGRNAEYTKLSDTGYRECQFCGFMCHRDRDKKGNVYSHDGSGTTLTTTYGTGGRIDPTVTAGCPQCGSFLWGK